MKTRILLRLSLLTAVSLVLFVAENQIPPPVPVPGVKLGLGNVIVVAVLFLYGRREALALLAVKVLLSALLTGNLGALAYSAAVVGLFLLYIAAFYSARLLFRRRAKQNGHTL